MRREDVQLLVAALASTLGPGPDRQPRRAQAPLAASLAHSLAAQAGTPVPGRLHAQVRRAMLQALQLILQCYDAWRDASIVIDAELRRTFGASAAEAARRAVEETGLLCEPGAASSALAPLAGDLDAIEPAALGAMLTDVIESELLGGIGDADMPLSFRDFLRGMGSGAPSWHDAFTLYFAWETKNDPAPLRAVLAPPATRGSIGDPAILHDGLLSRAPPIAQRFDTFLKSTRAATSGAAATWRLTDRARFVDLMALQAWHLAARAGVPAPALVASLEPICRAVGRPVDVETALSQSAARLAALWARINAQAATSPQAAEAAHALAQGDLAAAQQALSAAFAHARSAAERAEIRGLEGGLQSLAGLWRHASRAYMEAADLLKGEAPAASLACLLEVTHAFIREAEQTGDARGAETAAKLAENIVAWAGEAHPALRAEAGLARALAMLVQRRADGRRERVAALVRLVRRAVPLDTLNTLQASPYGSPVRIACELARATAEVDGEADDRALAADLVAALRAACGTTLSLRDDALMIASRAEIRAPLNGRTGDTAIVREAARELAEALTRLSRVEAPYLWSELQGRLGELLWRIAKQQSDDGGRAGRKSALVALERALQECAHDRGGRAAARHLAAIAEILTDQPDRSGVGAAAGRVIQALSLAEAVLPDETPPLERQQVALELAGALLVAGRAATGSAPTVARDYLEKAIAAFRRAAEGGSDPDNWRTGAQIYLKLGRAIAALAGLERSRARYEEAIVAYERVVALTADGKRAGARNRALQEIGELRQIVETLRRAEERYRHAQ